MSKKAFVPQRAQNDHATPVRVAVKAANALPEREPRSLAVVIGIPALLVGLIGTVVMMYVSGARSITSGLFPMVGILGMMMLMFSGRFGNARKITWGEMEKNRRSYLRDLDAEREEIQKAVCAQRNAQRRVHSTPRGLGAVIGSPRMWERRRQDGDFLDVRLGVGVQHAPDSVVSVQWPEIPVDEELEPVSGMALRDFILEQRKIRDIAKVLNLRSEPGFSFLGEDLDRVRSLLRSLLCSVAVFHNPRDVKLMVVTRNPEVWSWIAWLPHNQHDELFDACGWRRLVFSTPSELEETLGAELLKGSGGATRSVWTKPTAVSPTAMGSALESGTDESAGLGPHWIIVDDNTGSPEAWEGVIGQKGKQGMTVLRVASRVGVGVGFGREQVYELSERVSEPDDRAALAEIGGENDDPRRAPLLRHKDKFFAHADQLSVPRAYRYARAMARWTPASPDEVSNAASGAAELLRSLGITDPRELDVARLWAERRGRADARWAELPVGAKPNGMLQNITVRAKEYGGIGFHSLVIGTSGSGKSEFFLSLTYGAALTHSPETFNIVFVDMKFDSAAQDIDGLPHVVAALSNMGKDERHLTERMRRAIEGEIKRRYELFASVGARDANDYEEIRLAGRDLQPVPVLLVVIDEYLELFANHPDWIELIIHIGQVGRGANVFFMLGGQRLDLSALQKVKSNIGFRIALRAESGEDSRDVVGNDAAYHLPSKENGYALLKAGPRELEPFRCFYLSAPFVLPKRKREGKKTVDMTLTEPRLFGWEYQPLPAADAEALEAAAAADEEPDEFLYVDETRTKRKKIVDVLRESLMAVPHKAPHTMWLAPLEHPEHVDELVTRYRGKPWHVDYGHNAGLVFPIAIVDVPETAEQNVHFVDALRSNILVVGASQMGKSTTLMTLITSASLMYTPARLSFFCVGGPQLAQLLSVPHVADVVSPKDVEGVARTVATMEALVRSRDEAFRRDSMDINEFRHRRFGADGTGSGGPGGTDPEDRYGDVFLVIDGFAELYSDSNELGERIVRLSSEGPSSGVHVVITAGGYIHGQRQGMMQNFNVKIQLRLANPDENEMGGGSREAREAARRTLDSPGFGLTESAHEMLIGVPVIADGAGAPVQPRDIGALVAGVAGVDKHTTLMRLPERVLLREVLAAPGALDRSRPAITFAISEVRDLGPAPFALDAHPGLTIVGRQGCGKSTALAAIGEAVMARFSPEEAQLTIIDPNTGPLQHLVSPEYVRDYAYGQDHIDEVLTRLVTEVLAPRLPAEGLTQAELRAVKPWEGPRHFVLIDDAQDLRGQGSGFPPPPPVGAVLWKLMERARQIGLHVFLTRTLATNWAPMEMDPWIKFQTQAKMPKLFMDNDPSNRLTQGPQGIRAQALPPGRGLLLTNESEVEGILVGIPTILEGQTDGTD